MVVQIQQSYLCIQPNRPSMALKTIHVTNKLHPVFGFTNRGESCTTLQTFCSVVSKLLFMKTLPFSLVIHMTKCSSWRLRAFLFAFNHDIAITFLFLWASEIWEKHNLLLHSSDNRFLSWLVQPFVSLPLSPSMLLFSHFLFFPAKQQSTNPQRRN